MDIEKAKQVVQEISDVCKKHGVYIVGTCEDESMYSDIQIFEVGATGEWINPYEKANNQVWESYDQDGSFKTSGIC